MLILYNGDKEDDYMLNIKPISELRNYNKLLDEVKPNQPVILTKNGYGKYAIVDLQQLDFLNTMNELHKIMVHAEKSGTVSLDDFEKELNL
jgi:PHD/YefM family antitoxin component YafN of YafNO toxin-antitoxin module